jgi:hypothetical protein
MIKEEPQRPREQIKREMLLSVESIERDVLILEVLLDIRTYCACLFKLVAPVSMLIHVVMSIFPSAEIEDKTDKEQ